MISACRGANRKPAPVIAASPWPPTPTLSDAEAAARRDFTINAIAYDPLDGTVIDPHGGQADLRARSSPPHQLGLRG